MCEYENVLPFLCNRKTGAKVLLTKLMKGQYARVLQLPPLVEKVGQAEGESEKVVSHLR